MGVFLFVQLRWSPPSPDWWLNFDSIEEINQIHQLYEERDNRALLAFIEGTNNGQNIIRNRRDMSHFLRIVDHALLPTDSGWTSFGYEHGLGDLFVRYNMYDIALTFVIPAEAEAFVEVTERTSASVTRVDITREIAAFVRQENFDETSLRIGNGVQAFSFHRRGDDEGSIQERGSGWGVGVSLDVAGNFVSARVSSAPSLEAAFEILANVEFARGAW